MNKGQVLTPLPSHKDRRINYEGEQKEGTRGNFFDDLPDLTSQEVKETAKETVKEMKDEARQT